jgi:uncharacterized protein
VTNVAAFGAFVDVGVHQDGLVHVSELADRFVRDPREVVRVGQTVRVRVLEIDPARKRIALSMRAPRPGEAAGVSSPAGPARAAGERAAGQRPARGAQGRSAPAPAVAGTALADAFRRAGRSS